MTARGIRNCNPGNIERTAIQWNGMAGKQRDPRFVTFMAPEWGIRAIAKILYTYFHHRKALDGSRIDTAAELTTRWAPPHENDTDAYAAHLRAKLGVSEGEVIDLDDPDILTTVIETIILHENGEQPYPSELIREGVALAA